MRAILAALLGGLVLVPAPVAAAELVMVDSRACVYCARFDREVGTEYPETDAGRAAPLRKVSRTKKWPADLSEVAPAYYTPVFILVDQGREVGRFPGYTGEAAFWGSLNPLLAKLEPAKAVEPASSSLPATGGLW